MTARTAREDLLSRLVRALDLDRRPAPDPFADDEVASGPRVAVLVLATALATYEEAIRSIRATWAGDHLPGIDVWFVYGNLEQPDRFGYCDLRPWTVVTPPSVASGEVWSSGDVLVAGCADVIWIQSDCLLRKRLAALGHLLAQERYDFIATVCATSYVDPIELLDHVSQLPAVGVYQGPVGTCFETGEAYVSGSCILMSADIAAELVRHRDEIIEQNGGAYADDVAMSRWVAEHISDTDPPVIADNVAAGCRATGDATFVFPIGQVGLDVRSAKAVELELLEGAFHYHFGRQCATEMAALHQLCLEAGESRPGRSPRSRTIRPNGDASA